MTNVLCVTPHNRLEPGTIQAIYTQTYAGSLDHHFTRHNMEVVPGMNIVKAYQRLRAIFLAGDYTHLWIVENDIIPPPDALEKLLTVDADMAYGVYCFRRGTPVVNVMRHDTTDPLTNDGPRWERLWREQAVVDCAGLGFGCTLIRRSVLERFEMRTRIGGGDTDTELARDVKAAGLVQKAHLGVICGHIRPTHETLWPTGDRPYYRKSGVAVPQLVTVRALESFAHFDEDGTPWAVNKGDTGPLDKELAANMEARGQLVVVGPVAALATPPVGTRIEAPENIDGDWDEADGELVAEVAA